MVTVPEVQVPAATSYNGLADASLWLGITGGLMQAIGSYNALRAQKNQLKAEALNAEFAASQANIEARAMERDAVEQLNAGQKEAGLRGMIEAQDVADLRTTTAGSGVAVGVGNAAETERAVRVAAEVDKRRIRTGAEQRAQRIRNEAVNVRAGGILGRASAANMRSTARSISPAAGAIGSALGSAGPILGQYAAYQARR